MKVMKISAAVIAGTMLFSLVNTAFADINVTHSSSNVYKNVNSDFTISDTYYYSNEDKDTSNHTVVFTLSSNTADVDGNYMFIDDPPYTSNGKTMLPLRAVTETLKVFENNVNISWNSADKRAVISYGDNEIVFIAGKDIYTFNGENIKIADGIPEIKNGRIFIPVREIANAIDLTISWNPMNKEITISN